MPLLNVPTQDSGDPKVTKQLMDIQLYCERLKKNGVRLNALKALTAQMAGSFSTDPKQLGQQIETTVRAAGAEAAAALKLEQD